MQYIAINLECNQLSMNDGRNFKKKSLFEIIEIGAIKIDEQFNIIDTFKAYIKPSIYKFLSRRVTELTHITKEDLKDSSNFNITIEHFKKWIGNEDSTLCLWAKDSIKILIQSIEYFETEITLQDLFVNFLDVQAETAKYFKLWNQPSQILAVEKFKILIESDISESTYSALDKAYCTTHILKALNNNGLYFDCNKKSVNLSFKNGAISRTNLRISL